MPDYRCSLGNDTSGEEVMVTASSIDEARTLAAEQIPEDTDWIVKTVAQLA